MISTRRKMTRSADPSEYTPCYAYESARRENARSLLRGRPARAIADAVGTPAYVYSRASIESAYRALDRSFGKLPHALCYAVKANSNLVRSARIRAARQQL